MNCILKIGDKQDLKDYRNKEFRNYIFGNIILYFFFTYGIDFIQEDFNSTTENIVYTLIPTTVISGILLTYAFVIDSLISSNFKTRFVFLNKEMPGAYVFSNIKNGKYKDNRFLYCDVLNTCCDIYENMPNDTKEKTHYENSKWYGIYLNHQGNEKIKSVQHDFLLCRDLTAATVSITTIYLVLSAFIGTISCQFIGSLLIEYIVCSCAAQNKAKRFVLTVISEDVNNKKQKGLISY